jgi:hypothetical protein
MSREGGQPRRAEGGQSSRCCRHSTERLQPMDVLTTLPRLAAFSAPSGSRRRRQMSQGGCCLPPLGPDGDRVCRRRAPCPAKGTTRTKAWRSLNWREDLLRVRVRDRWGLGTHV